MTGKSKCLPRLEINFPFEGERWIARLGDGVASRIEIVLDGGRAQLNAQLLQHGLDIKAIRRAVSGGPLAILLDRIIEVSS